MSKLAIWERYPEIRNILREKFGVVLGVAAATTITVGIGTYLYKKRNAILKTPEEIKMQSTELERGIRTSLLAPYGDLTDFPYEDVTTLYESFNKGMRLSENGPCLGTRSGDDAEYKWMSYQQVSDRARRLASGFLSEGLPAGQQTFVGIFAQNSAEWVITAEACHMFSMVIVPLYDTLGVQALSYIMEQTDMPVVVCDKAVKAEALLQNANTTSNLKIIVVVEPISKKLETLAKEVHIKVIPFTEMEMVGSISLMDPVPPKPDDLCTICYTSGTTGNPKGVILTHKNILSDVNAAAYAAKFAVTKDDVHLSYLPLAHMFDRAFSAYVLQQGGRIGFFRGDAKLLLEDMAALKPTLFPTVPRLLNRIYDKVMAGASKNRIKFALLHLALRRKMALLKKGIITKTSIWDRLVFSKIQNMMGGRVRIVITGSAPISAEVLTFMRCAVGCPVVEGYGQTEATAALTVTDLADTTAGHVGVPVPCVLIKLDDVPEMDYFADKGKGEVCAKGNCVMKGYYKEPEKTAEALDKDGWLHTGDIGMWLPNGTLKIIDRKKHIFKLAQGEYIAPEKIESIYVQSSLVAQAYVDGNSLESCVLGIMVPDPEVLPGWAKSRGISGTMDELCKHPEIKKAILADIVNRGKEASLKSFEQVKDICLHPELFSVENGFLTPTFKSKRPVLRTFFSNKFDEMYANMKY